MSTKERIRRSVVAQFHHPTGAGGHVAGWIMSHRPSNLARNRWAVDLLDIQATERVLELGCGPGVALAEIAHHVVDGVAIGVDHSPVMIRHAERRNAAAVAAGRVQLVCAAVEDLLPTDGDVPRMDRPPFDEPFQVVLAVNNVGVWDQPERRLAALRRLMQPGGRVAVVTQPRCAGATAETSRASGTDLAGLFDEAGYTSVTSATLDLDPPAVCVLATRP